MSRLPDMARARRAGLLAAACVATASVGLSSPALAGPPFITDDPEPVELGHWEVYGFSAGAIGRHDASGLGPSLEVNYGAAPNLQLHVITGLAYDDPSGSGVRMGVSDTELGAKYRFLTPGDDDWWPQVGVFPLIEVPTGNSERGLGAGYVQAFLPVWIQKDFGKWTTYGGGYWINPGVGNRDYWFTGALLQRQVMDKLAWAVKCFTRHPAWSGAAGQRASTSAAFTISRNTITCCFPLGGAECSTRWMQRRGQIQSPIISPSNGHFNAE